MRKNLIAFIKLVDSMLSRFPLRISKKKNFLIIFTFHGLFCNEKERTFNLVDHRLYMPIKDFRQFVEYSLDENFIFISPNDILKGLNNDKNYILITFDDGYFNNQHALPIFREFEIPGLFSISTNHVKYNKCFWWDVLYREGIKRGMSIKEITKKNKQLKLFTAHEREKYLMNLYGKEAFKPVSDIDRPFTPSELKDFSKDVHVFLGNHTNDHHILSKHSLEETKSFILCAQNDIYDITGKVPIAISYPDGTYSNEIIETSKEIGLKLGFTGKFKKNYLPIDSQGNDFMRLSRFNLYGCNNNKEYKDLYHIFMTDGTLFNMVTKKFLVNR